MLNFEDFIKKFTGQPVDTDGIYPNQCMDLMHKYVYEVLGLPDPTLLSAKQAKLVYLNFRPEWGKYFTLVANTPQNMPSKGNIVFWNGTDGHVAICIDSTVNDFHSFDANYPVGSLPHIQYHNYVNVLGWLVPKTTPVITPNYLLGIDVGVDQKDIDYTKLNKDFVIISATEGDGFTSVKLARNQTEARKKGLLIGYYHFARFDLGNTAIAEADYFLKQLGALQEGEVLFLDYEIAFPDPVRFCKAWLDRVYEKTGVKPLMYLNQNTIKNLDWKPVIDADYGLWLANYPTAIDAPIPTTKWAVTAFRQYNNKEVVDGVPAVCDADIFYGDKVAFKAYGFKAQPTPPQPVPDPCKDIQVQYETAKTMLTDMEDKLTVEKNEHVKTSLELEAMKGNYDRATNSIGDLQKQVVELKDNITALKSKKYTVSEALAILIASIKGK